MDKLILAAVLIILACIFAPLLIQWIWNDTIIKLFSVPTITFWQSFKLMIITSILFGSGNLIRNSSD